MLSQRSAASWMRSATDSLLKSNSLLCMPPVSFTAVVSASPAQNTYADWKASRFAREGVQCQDCHMPERRHRWRGIHDADMVRSGLTITARPGAARYRAGDVAVVTLRVTSTRIGHAFPTYVTPRVVLSA